MSPAFPISTRFALEDGFATFCDTDSFALFERGIELSLTALELRWKTHTPHSQSSHAIAALRRNSFPQTQPKKPR
jgi:hypothetical protein